MKEFWDERFGSEAYIYGTQPNEFFKQTIETLEPGKIFLPAEGEGRNAIYAAGLGWKVRAFDYSEEGRKKALKLAQKNKVSIDYQLGSLYDFQADELYDAIGLVFLHFFPGERSSIHRELINSLKPGGVFIAELFHKEQINNSSGGPPDIDLLYSVEDIQKDFSDFHIEQLSHEKIVLDEGPLHQGAADVIRLFARKPKN